ncbi:MAG: preprotein translocase subunit SecG [Lachnospiraceae bacterium]|nr:preprotein translocase subunit SecG [Lachnospiraceae bacterium]
MTTTVIKTIATVIYIVICVALVIVVLMQEGKTSGLGAVSGAADSYWTKNKGRSAEGILVKITRVLAILFVLLSLVLCTDWLG